MANQRRSGRRTDYRWSGSTFAFPAVATANLTQIIFNATAATTLMRSRGAVLLSLIDQAVGDQKVVGLGLIVVTEAAVAAGGSALPSPISVPEAEWVWHQYVPLQSQTVTEDPSTGEGTARIIIDSKAMRKMKPNESLVLVLDAADLAGSVSAMVTGGIRALSGS